ncbi:disease resistance protein RPV1-like isoform X2 [Rosa rugosa]|uniref:disease resistance protein RPV1-like isoform X2 n=1 Tax=Rosa rugosa TaxID=74645 RepID=UPI002B400A34|nr:disease resistance protein RPV1-like isoform X2 [Rosa rugosa]
MVLYILKSQPELLITEVTHNSFFLPSIDSMSSIMYFQPFIPQTHPIFKPYGFNRRSIFARKKLTARFRASSSSSSSSSTNHSWTYDVFLSFRGEDTRSNFVGHLHSNLVRRGIKTFLDDDGLGRGEEISPALLKAIEESKISVVVLSKNYASSKWCLEELVKILQCRESKQQMVYPVFYKVDPSDVRHRNGSFGEALAHHAGKFKDNLKKVVEWNKALTTVGNLSGWHFLDGGHESKFVDAIVEEISRKLLDYTYLSVAKYPVGIKSRVESMLNLLCIGKNDVHIVGIWGVGGIGKTTIAKAVYNSIAYKFEGNCFLANVREESMRSGGLVRLQKTLLRKILRDDKLKVPSVDEGITMIKERLCHKRVLLVLDDVNQLNQLNKIAGNPNWFGSGSRIIVTTRDKHCLTACDVNEIYEVKKLSHHEALELFNFNAFQEHRHMNYEYVELVNSVLLYAQGLPLALEVLGSSLRGRNVNQWKCALDSYKSLPKQEIQEVLKISYDALEPLIKEVFLHIACFFIGKSKNYVTDALEGCDLPKFGIELLKEKALINVTEANDIEMHDLLEEMGQEIVFQESPSEPGQRSRLWRYEDVHRVFVENTGTDKVRGIMVDDMNGLGENIRLNSESFLKMRSLQILIISGDVFTGDYVNYLSNELRVLNWDCCPFLSFPPNFNPKKLVVLKMHRSFAGEVLQAFFQPWSGKSPLGIGLEIMQSLMYKSECFGLKRIRVFSRFPNLVDMNMSNCRNLVEIKIGFLKNLVNLDLGGCWSLRKFEIAEVMESLKSLDLSYTAIKELSSSSIGNLISLEMLTLRACDELTKVPTESEISTIYSTSLQEKHYDPLIVNLSECRNLVEISDFHREIYGLDASGCHALRKISRLSNILEGKESTMIPWMNLHGCDELCNNLAHDYVEKLKKNLPDDSVVTALLSLFLSCRQSEFEVAFPGSEFPEWFTCRMDFERFLWPRDVDKKGSQVYNFRIEFPEDFRWEKKGLAFCLQTERERFPWFGDPYFRLCSIYINGVCINKESKPLRSRCSGKHLWLCYVPFNTIIRRLSESGLPPPSICLVEFEFEYQTPKSHEGFVKQILVREGSCGVHVVMPEDEGVFVNSPSSAGTIKSLESGRTATLDQF